METGCTLWFTGMSGSGKSTLSKLVGERLSELGARVEVLDGASIPGVRRCHIADPFGNRIELISE